MNTNFDIHTYDTAIMCHLESLIHNIQESAHLQPKI